MQPPIQTEFKDPTSDPGLKAFLNRRLGRQIVTEIKCEGVAVIKSGGIELLTRTLTDKGFAITTEIPPLSVLDEVTPVNQKSLRIKFRVISENLEDVIPVILSSDPSKIESSARCTTKQWTLPHIEQGRWDNWSMGGTFDAHLSLVEKSSNLVASTIRKLNLRPKNILFVGCGRCFEVIDFIQHFKDQLRGANIICMDSSHVQLAYADDLDIRDCATALGARILLARENFFEFGEKYKSFKPDLIIGQGVFDRATLTRNQGYKLAEQIRIISSPDTVGLFTAYGLNLFDLAAWRSAGFNPVMGSRSDIIFNQHGMKSDI